ncbi:restriction endonuclease subunit S [Pseudoalteromonas piscicida]|uniref:restriction endonuclease subunit S n=1 Tax=Pseudoalteromonas piscicida TaxID=43662 RepID=UPI0032BFAC7C
MTNLELKPVLRFPEFTNFWTHTTISDCGIVVTGSTPSTSNQAFYGGHFNFISPADMQGQRYVDETKTTLTEAGFNKCRKLPPSSILFVCIGSSIGKVAQVTKESCSNQQINALVVNENNSSDFLFSLLEKQSSKIAILAGEQAVPIINKSQFSKVKLVTPSCKIEQQKIADFLSSVDKKISLLKEKHALIAQYKKGVMQKLFKQEIRFKDDNGNDFPAWQTISLSKLASKNSIKNKDESVNIVLTNSAKDGIVNQGDYFKKDIANQGNLGGYTVVEKNDFVYNPRISELAPVGPIKRNHIGQGVMSPLYTVFRFKDDSLLDYLELYFNTTMWHRYMHSIANFGARHDRMNITTSDFYALPLPIPSEEERAKIVSFVNALEAKVNAVKQQIELTQTFKKGLLQQMFV